jgi:hypothetical protein
MSATKIVQPLEYADDPNVSEFTCSDCAVPVIGLGAIVVRLPPRCAMCEWMADFVGVNDRAELRAFLQESTGATRAHGI